MDQISENRTGKRMFRESEVNWEELAGIGIHREELRRDGSLEMLLAGEKVEIIALQFTLPGVDITLDATVQITEDNSVPMLEICGMQAGHEY